MTYFSERVKFLGKGQSAKASRLRLPKNEFFGERQDSVVVVKQPLDGGSDQVYEFDREAAILRHLNILHICCRYQCDESSSKDEQDIKQTVLIVPIYQGKSLEQFIQCHKNNPGGNIKILKAFIFYCKAVKELHEKGVILGDTEFWKCINSRNGT